MHRGKGGSVTVTGSKLSAFALPASSSIHAVSLSTRFGARNIRSAQLEHGDGLIQAGRLHL